MHHACVERLWRTGTARWIAARTPARRALAAPCRNASNISSSWTHESSASLMMALCRAMTASKLTPVPAHSNTASITSWISVPIAPCARHLCFVPHEGHAAWICRQWTFNSTPQLVQEMDRICDRVLISLIISIKDVERFMFYLHVTTYDLRTDAIKNFKRSGLSRNRWDYAIAVSVVAECWGHLNGEPTHSDPAGSEAHRCILLSRHSPTMVRRQLLF